MIIIIILAERGRESWQSEGESLGRVRERELAERGRESWQSEGERVRRQVINCCYNMQEETTFLILESGFSVLN